MMKIVMIVALAVSAAPASVLADFDFTGNEALRLCGGLGGCPHFVIAAHNMHVVTMIVGGNQPYYCFPVGGEVGQMTDVFVAYLKANAAKRQDPALIMFLAAMLEAFPCKTNQ